MKISTDTIQWLLAGDPAILWQVMCDLIDAPESEWQTERRQLLKSGWVADLHDVAPVFQPTQTSSYGMGTNRNLLEMGTR